MSDVAEVLELARRHGIEIESHGDILRVRASAEPPPEVLAALRQSKLAILAYLRTSAPPGVDLHTHTYRGAKSAKNTVRDGGEETVKSPFPSPAWDAETAALIEWFLKTPLPTEPFEMYQGVTVLRPDRFWESLKGDIAAGPGKARAYTGAFQKDLRRLAELFGGPAKFRQLKG